MREERGREKGEGLGERERDSEGGEREGEGGVTGREGGEGGGTGREGERPREGGERETHTRKDKWSSDGREGF